MKAKMTLLIATALSVLLTSSTKAQQNYSIKPVPIQSRWAKEVSPTNALKEYPRPQLTRANWTNLNGLWEYAITGKNAGKPGKFDGQILVPYPLESALSGVQKTLLPDQLLWYKRAITKPVLNNGEKVLLHFGAADWQATVYLNGKETGKHQGGYTEFTMDVTSFLKDGQNELAVRIYDPTDQGIGPHGKQVLNPQNIYYTPTSGIWQTVWLEVVPADHVERLEITPDIDKSIVNVRVDAGTDEPVSIVLDGQTVTGKANTSIAVPVKNAKLWSPASPFLYDLKITLGKDQVKSYFGMRKISIGKDEKGVDRIMLNNKPYFNLGTLDQGFWPEGLYTAPTDEALAFDIKAIKAMGFNTIRKHIKVEPARWYYWADKLGMLVWQDLVNPNQGLPEGSKPEFEREAAEEVLQLHNSPSIVCWVLFNEKWGQYDQERLTKWLKEADSSRIVNGHTGELLYVNEQLRSPSPNAYVGADITDVHSYPDPMISIKQAGKAQVVGEFGGIGVFIPDHQWNTSSAWGYVQEKPAALLAKYRVMNQHLQLLQQEGLSASIYTQPFDVEGEQNGLMTYDREVVKIPFAELRKIHAALNPDMGKLPEVSAKDADLTDPLSSYSQALQKYLDGKRDPGFLKQLAMQAAQAGDKPGALIAGKAYVASLKWPLSEQDIRTVAQFTMETGDKGFALMQANEAAFKKVLGDRVYTVAVMNAVYHGVMEPLLTVSDNSDWSKVDVSVKPYGAPGEEMLLRAKAIHFVNHQDWKNYVPTAKVYLEKYGANIPEQEKQMFQQAIEQHAQE